MIPAVRYNNNLSRICAGSFKYNTETGDWLSNKLFVNGKCFVQVKV